MEIVIEFIENIQISSFINKTMLVFNWISTIYIIYFFFSKEGRDERGMKIFASASIIGVIIFFIYTNLIQFIIRYIGDYEKFIYFYYVSSYFMLTFPIFASIIIKKRLE